MSPIFVLVGSAQRVPGFLCQFLLKLIYGMTSCLSPVISVSYHRLILDSKYLKLTSSTRLFPNLRSMQQWRSSATVREAIQRLSRAVRTSYLLCSAMLVNQQKIILTVLCFLTKVLLTKRNNAIEWIKCRGCLRSYTKAPTFNLILMVTSSPLVCCIESLSISSCRMLMIRSESLIKYSLTDRLQSKIARWCFCNSHSREVLS